MFGSLCYTHKQARDKDKFGHRSRSCVFVGYSFGKKGWKVYDLEKEEFLVSRDVVFQETFFLLLVLRAKCLHRKKKFVLMMIGSLLSH